MSLNSIVFLHFPPHSSNPQQHRTNIPDSSIPVVRRNPQRKRNEEASRGAFPDERISDEAASYTSHWLSIDSINFRCVRILSDYVRTRHLVVYRR
jgi:hypothetical protein